MSVNTFPTAGFSPDDSTSKLILNGAKITADVTDAISQAQLDRTLVGASTLTLTVEDPDRTLVASPIAQIVAPTPPGTLAAQAPYEPTTCALTGSDGTPIYFALCSVEKRADELTLTFEDLWINSLRNVYAQGEGYYTAAGTMTRAEFMAAVIRKALPLEPIPVVVVPSDFSANGFSVQALETDSGDSQWGTSSDPNEDAWTCLTRLANDAEWRCYSNGKAIVIGPDAWLMTLPVETTFVEHTGGVDSIDFTWDMNQAQATLSVAANVALTTFPPGSPIRVKNLGVASGVWLVSDVSRSLFLPDATIKAVQPQPSLTEAQIAANNSAGTSATGTQTASTTAAVVATGGAPQAQQAVQYALAQTGKPYVWGGTGPAGFDCSGLCQAAYASAGVPIPRTSEDQYSGLTHVSVSQLLPGDLVFYNWGEDGVAGPGHVVMYIGNGQVVEAAHTGTVISVHAMYGGQVGAARPAAAAQVSTGGALA